MDQSFVRNVVINRFWIYQPQVVFMQTMYYSHVKLKFEPLSFVEERMPLEYPDKNPQDGWQQQLTTPNAWCTTTTHNIQPMVYHPRCMTQDPQPLVHDQLPTTYPPTHANKSISMLLSSDLNLKHVVDERWAPLGTGWTLLAFVQM